MTDYLFVYGTLLPGVARAELGTLVRGLPAVGRAWIPGKLYDLGPYPGAVLGAASGSRVWGFALALPEDRQVLAVLDAYEGCQVGDRAASLFWRERCTAFLEDGTPLSCWVYTYNRDLGGAVLIPHGDYLVWQSEKESG